MDTMQALSSEILYIVFNAKELCPLIQIVLQFSSSSNC